MLWFKIEGKSVFFSILWGLGNISGCEILYDGPIGIHLDRGGSDKAILIPSLAVTPRLFVIHSGITLCQRETARSAATQAHRATLA